jgi:hypothetical protein
MNLKLTILCLFDQIGGYLSVSMMFCIALLLAYQLMSLLSVIGVVMAASRALEAIPIAGFCWSFAPRMYLPSFDASHALLVSILSRCVVHI